MRILADECLDRPLIHWLRQIGHDVAAVAEMQPAADDSTVLSLATADHRILVTADLDYGEMVFRWGKRVEGLVLVRIRSRSSSELLSKFQAGWNQIEHRIPGHFSVLTHSTIRVRPLP